MMHAIARAARAIGAIVAITVVTGCLREPVRVENDLAALRGATARFHDAEAAEKAGYSVLVTHPTTGAACLDHPTDGGMGRHMLNEALVDSTVSVTEPEVLVYEPQKNGRLRLVGVEYVIPY